ncbi:hypothetical protein D9758_001578 [Tetrapyrgos nigripes]|uniref:F-box domain-containing protein n=1 Tax=Tetrapyrgos nigripes TaxID=182062 RepID=A0A8H5LXE1_9AGAR|nr:hypothetical protein D9758_001578 [Tetrapyrgos nigripes]
MQRYLAMDSLCTSNPSLTTTDAVQEKDIYHIRQICSEYTQDLDRMNAQIERLKASLDAITQKRDSLQEKVASLKSITSPLRGFPTEILQHIFLHSLPPFSTLDRVQSPINVAQTCSRWRSVAIGTPELWTAFHIFVPEVAYSFDPHTSKCNTLREGLECFLSRSGCCPLSISVYSVDANRWRSDYVLQVTRIVEMLILHHRRWKYLNLRVPRGSLFPVQRLRGEDFPCLETVILHGSPGFSDDIISSTFFDNALRLGQMDRPFYDVRHDSSLAHLTHLVINRILGISHLLVVLEKCVHLVDLSVNPRFDSSHIPLSMITLPKLQKLVVRCVLYNHPDEFLDHLTLPKLQVLILKETSGEVHQQPGTISSLEDLFLRSECCLTNLELRCDLDEVYLSEFPVEDAISFFKSLPHLKQLALPKKSFMSEGLLRALTAVSSSSSSSNAADADILCPRLTRIQFHDFYAFSEQTLLAFLSARLFPPASPLSSVVPLEQVRIMDARGAFGSDEFSQIVESGKVEFVDRLDLRNREERWRSTPLSRSVDIG